LRAELPYDPLELVHHHSAGVLVEYLDELALVPELGILKGCTAPPCWMFARTRSFVGRSLTACARRSEVGGGSGGTPRVDAEQSPTGHRRSEVYLAATLTAHGGIACGCRGRRDGIVLREEMLRQLLGDHNAHGLAWDLGIILRPAREFRRELIIYFAPTVPDGWSVLIFASEVFPDEEASIVAGTCGLHLLEPPPLGGRSIRFERTEVDLAFARAFLGVGMGA